MSAADISPFERALRAAGQPELAIRTFAHYYRQLTAGQTGLIPEADLAPVTELPDAERLGALSDAGRAALGQVVIIKLNGGLGTSMGMDRAKSLLEVKAGASFLDLIARQVLHLRAAHGVALPLLLMNSFRTHADSLSALGAFPELASGLPLGFMQHKIPKVCAADLTPARWPADPELEWCPPGHGDLYTALRTSGMLARLLDRGVRYAFVSNADNLGAVLHLGLLGWLVSSGAPFVMEVADRTEADRKGGHLAVDRRGGGLVLRERAQCPAADLARFQQWRRHRYFNTNNLWIDLRALDAALRARGGLLGLPLIVNPKPIDPVDPSSPPVLQLETAMGAAISVFDGARAVRVPRARFAPVKTTNDLLALWSDAYVLTADERVIPSPQRTLGPPVIDLDPRYCRRVADLRLRFPHGAPSLVNCERLRIRGDVRFGAGVICEGVVEIEHDGDEPRLIPDGARLGG